MMFSKFIEIQLLNGVDKQEILHFTKLMGRERDNLPLISSFVPAKTIKAYLVNSEGIDSTSNILLIIIRSLSIFYVS